MKRRTFVIAPLVGALLSIAAPAFAAPISLNRLSAYLNDLQTVKGDFTQVNADGSIDTGTIYIRRPGRARFEYNKPNDALVMAGGSQVAVFDPVSPESANIYPLNRTPLSIILARNVNLGQAKMVVDHRQVDNTTVVKAQDPAHPEYGNIQLVFTDNPVQLRQWIITDDSGNQTTMILGDTKTGMSLSNELFNIQHEQGKRQYR
ncbi:outer membrane lipoprotein carrier protein LolA [Donghicola sp. C2-DW-16]|uniref:Outer membrane lipoprotein carrier protein LolA n=1 Tax=Donghicola mangrovi TaxID=2729614 RepID=A0ABX2P9R7_9RHOB|nr:outer membrane lipoprotein carrier protein LolA [Donghicola mangrovi]NVO25861.1 outer membrane lipoprotein carrier protein LolA [Donghicola mangrovi]